MKRNTFWTILFNPLFLVLYFLELRVLYQLCQFGGVQKRVPILMILGAIALLWALFLIVTFIFKNRTIGKKEQSVQKIWIKKCEIVILTMELIVMIGITIFFGYKIYESSISFQGKLFWYIWEKQSSCKIPLEHNNFFESGAEGIIKDLETKLDIPEDLYIENNFLIDYKSDGTITYINAFLYGKSQEDTKKTYLIDYDIDKGDMMTVWLDGNVNAQYLEQNKLQPMIIMLNKFLKSNTYDKVLDTKKGEDTLYSVKYAGYETTTITENTEYLLIKNGKLEQLILNNYGEAMNGFIISIEHNDGKTIKLVSDIDTMKTKEEVEKLEQSEENQTGKLVEDDEGGMSYYLDNFTVMKLSVVDAALGSRFYAFQGENVYNEDPFCGRTGVAEGICFLDAKTGFLLLKNVSSDYSDIYYTKDGGENFIMQDLPVDAGEADLIGNEYNFTPEKFHYCDVPYKENGTIYVKVSLDAADLNTIFMLFCSADNGETWSYQSFTNE